MLIEYCTAYNEKGRLVLCEKNAFVCDELKQYDNCELIAEFFVKEIGIGSCTEEYVYALYLDSKMHLKALAEISHGGRCEAVVDVAVVFRNALLLDAEGIVLVHNHPSGDASPSDRDRELTDTLKKAGELLGIRLHDHVVIGRVIDGRAGYVSIMGGVGFIDL